AKFAQRLRSVNGSRPIRGKFAACPTRHRTRSLPVIPKQVNNDQYAIKVRKGTSEHPRSVFGLLARARRSTVLVTVLALPLSLMGTPANAQDPTPASTSAPTSKKATFSRSLQAAWDEAARTGRPVEVPSRFTETMKVWAQPDGKRLKAALYTRPVQLRNPDKGTWEPIDTRIVTRDGTLQAARVKTPL